MPPLGYSALLVILTFHPSVSLRSQQTGSRKQGTKASGPRDEPDTSEQGELSTAKGTQGEGHPGLETKGP